MIPLYGYDVARTLPVCDHDVAVTAGDQAVAKMVIFYDFYLDGGFSLNIKGGLTLPPVNSCNYTYCKNMKALFCLDFKLKYT